MEDWQYIVGALVILLPPILNWYSSKQYRDAKDAEFTAKVTEYTSRLNSKDEQIKTIEEKFDSMVTSKDEQIKLYEKLSSPEIIDRYDKKILGLETIIGELNTEVNELNQEVASLHVQLIEEKRLRHKLESELGALGIPQEAQNVVHAYTAGSLAALEQFQDTVNAVTTSGEIIQRKAEQIVKLATLEINPHPTESVTVSDVARVEITDPDEDTLAGVEKS